MGTLKQVDSVENNRLQDYSAETKLGISHQRLGRETTSQRQAADKKAS